MLGISLVITIADVRSLLKIVLVVVNLYVEVLVNSPRVFVEKR